MESIATAQGVSIATVHKRLKKSGIHTRPRGVPRGFKRPPSHGFHVSIASRASWAKKLGALFGCHPDFEAEYKRQRRWHSRFHRLVLDRDGHRCCQCGSGDGLEVHHIVPVRINPDRATDTENGMTLCKACHRNIHR